MNPRKFDYQEVHVAAGKYGNATPGGFRCHATPEYCHGQVGQIVGWSGSPDGWTYRVSCASWLGGSYERDIWLVPEERLSKVGKAKVKIDEVRPLAADAVSSTPCPRKPTTNCLGHLDAGGTCTRCGWPQMGLVNPSCLHHDLRVIEHGDHRGKVSCLAPGCGARFDIYPGLGLERPDPLTVVRSLRASDEKVRATVQRSSEMFFVSFFLRKRAQASSVLGTRICTLPMIGDNMQAKRPAGGYHKGIR